MLMGYREGGALPPKQRVDRLLLVVGKMGVGFYHWIAAGSAAAGGNRGCGWLRLL